MKQDSKENNLAPNLTKICRNAEIISGLSTPVKPQPMDQILSLASLQTAEIGDGESFTAGILPTASQTFLPFVICSNDYASNDFFIFRLYIRLVLWDSLESSNY